MRVLIIILTLFVSCKLQAQNINWSRGAAKTELSAINSLNVDGNGNSYFGGMFSDTVITEEFNFKTQPGKYKILCGKYKNDGTLIWAAADGECDAIYSYSSAYDQSGNLYVGGSCRGDITFNGITYQNINSGFLAKFDNQGNPQWIELVKGIFDSYSSGISFLRTDSENNIYIFGSFVGAVDFGDTTVASLPKPWSNAVLAKYNPSGKCLWARSYLPTGVNLPATKPSSLEIDEDNNVYVAGGLVGTLTLNSTTSVTSDGEDIFLLKLDRDGNSKWLTKIGIANTSEFGQLSDICNGTMYFCMRFQGDSTIVNGEIYKGVVNKHNVVTGNVLIKFDTSGAVQWSKLIDVPVQNAGYVNTMEVDLDKTGDAIVSGCYGGSIDFIDTTLSNDGDLDPFILRFDHMGNLLEIWSEGYKTDEYISSTEIDACGNYYVAGMFFDSTGLGGVPLKTKNSKWSYFLTKISTNSECEIITGIEQRVELSDVTIFPNPVYNKEVVQIEIAKAMYGPATIKIRDLVGNMVYEQSVSNKSNTRLEVAAGNLVTGTYFVEIYDGRKLQVKKLVVIE